MRIISLVSVAVFFLAVPSYGADNAAWTSMDTVLQSSFLILLAVDWQQTREFSVHRSDYPEDYQVNPLLRGHPTARDANRMAAAAALIHTGIAYVLPRPYRTIWQGFWIGVEGEAVLSNCVAGIKLNF